MIKKDLHSKITNILDNIEIKFIIIIFQSKILINEYQKI
jgi:hypothetical protein